jgi:two-component system sensor histidine kinase UhpB
VDRTAVPLFWRLFIPNACVLAVACAVLIVEPANGRVFALVGGLAIMLATNVVLMRRAFAPLMRLTATMDRVAPTGPASEVTTLASAFNAMLDRIETERRESALRAAAGEQAERRHVAAELHDEVGQTLTALVLQIGRIKAKGGSPEDLAQAQSTAESALEDVRRLARSLRPEVLDELGLTAALNALFNRLSEQTGLVIHRTLPEPAPPLTADEQLVVYRIAQESLTNVVRHSGAGAAHVTLRHDGRHVELLVRDDGVGIPATARAGNGGVRGMRERALLIGAELTLGPASPGGTAVRLRVPVGEPPA